MGLPTHWLVYRRFSAQTLRVCREGKPWDTENCLALSCRGNDMAYRDMECGAFMVKRLRSSRGGLRLALAFSVGLAAVSPAGAQSLTDRFKSLFGGKSEEPAQTAPAPGQPPEAEELVCPPVTVRAGTSTYTVGLPGKRAADDDVRGNDVSYQATITKMARECIRNGSDITARVGIQGRVIAGPAGAPSVVEIPLVVALTHSGVSEKTIAFKTYRTTVQMSQDGTVPFTFVAEDLVYPKPSAAVEDSYIFYVGFDTRSVSREPKAKPKKKK